MSSHALFAPHHLQYFLQVEGIFCCTLFALIFTHVNAYMWMYTLLIMSSMCTINVFTSLPLSQQTLQVLPANQ